MFDTIGLSAQRRGIDVSGDGVNNSGRPAAARVTRRSSAHCEQRLVI